MSRIAVVTGGTRGIGRAISVSLKEAGYKVVASYERNVESARDLEKQFNIPTYQFSVSDYEQCAKVTQDITHTFGPIDILVNNAGITRDGMFHKMALENWLDVINTNLNSCFNMCRSVINNMRERKFGRIINIASVNAQKGQMGQSNYSAAKAGVIGFTKALAQEVANKGITVNAVAPGYIDTDMVRSVPEEVLANIISTIPVGRLGTPEEVAKAILFLASKEAGFITGSTISLNGGQYFA